jgi:uncharacterized membrane protein YkoI
MNAVCVAGSLLLLPVVASAYDGEKLEKTAAIKMVQATAIALKARPGMITDRELEKEKGGSGLRYSFDIKSKGVTYEVGVDAKTGAILENGKEGKNPD